MNKLIVLTGKTASGKDTVMAAILKEFPDLKRIVSTTSRFLRNGEKNGVDYNFISKEEFEQKIKNGDFIEYVQYGGNLYGTEKSQILDNLDSNLIWRIDPSRAGKVRELVKDFTTNVTVIYLTTDDEVILQRLRGRNLQEEEIVKRMQDDEKLWDEHKDNYDFIIENIPGKLKETIDQIIEIINFS